MLDSSSSVLASYPKGYPGQNAIEMGGSIGTAYIVSSEPAQKFPARRMRLAASADDCNATAAVVQPHPGGARQPLHEVAKPRISKSALRALRS